MTVKSEDQAIYRTAATPAVIFAHGNESGPLGGKMLALAEVAAGHGLEVAHPDFRGMDDPEDRVTLLLEVASEMQQPFVLVGSSMGGYVALRASSTLQTKGLFLMAPAVGIQGYYLSKSVPGCDKMTIIHAWQDEIIPAQNVINFAEHHHAELHLVNSDHRLTGQIPFLSQLFVRFLEKL